MSAPGQAEVEGAEAGTLMAAGALSEATIYAANGEKLGKVVEVMIEAGHGRIAYVVMTVGGVLGIGEKLFAVPWGAIIVDPVTARLSVAVTAADLDAAAGFDKDGWPANADHHLFPDV